MKAGLDMVSSPRSSGATPSTSQSHAWKPPPTPRRACGACTPTGEGSWPLSLLPSPQGPASSRLHLDLSPGLSSSICLSGLSPLSGLFIASPAHVGSSSPTPLCPPSEQLPPTPPHCGCPGIWQTFPGARSPTPAPCGLRVGWGLS